MTVPATDRVLELRGLLRRLRTLTMTISDNTDIGEIISIGREIWRLDAECHKVKGLVKDRVRSETKGLEPGHYDLDGLDYSVVEINVAESRPTMRNGTSQENIVAVLGSNLFRKLFTSKVLVRPRRDFRDKVIDLDPDTAAKVLGFIDNVVNKPRLSFTRKV